MDEPTPFLKLLELLKSQPDKDASYGLRFQETTLGIDLVDARAAVLLQHFGEAFPEATNFDALNAFTSAVFWLQFTARVGGADSDDDEREET